MSLQHFQVKMLRRFAASPMTRAAAPLRFAGAAPASTGAPNPPVTSGAAPFMDWKTATPSGSTRNDSALDDVVKVGFVGFWAWWWVYGPGYNTPAPYHY